MLLPWCAHAAAADWTALHGSNPAGTGVAGDEQVKLPLKESWTFQTGGRVRSSGAIVGDIVYIGSADGNVYALDAQTGEKRWAFRTGAEVYSSPAVANGLVFVGSRDGRIYALDAETGAAKWTHQVGRPVRASGVVVDSVLYIGSGEVPHERGLFEQTRPNLWALDVETGEVEWQYNCGGIWSRPAVADGVVYIATLGANISAVSARTGEEKWSVHTQAGPFWASPVLSGRSLFIGSIDKNLKRLYVMDVENGHWRWIAEAGGPSEPTVCVCGGVVYYWGYWNGVAALDMARIPKEIRDTSAPPDRNGWVLGTHPGSLLLGYRVAENGRKVATQLHRVFGKRGKTGKAGYRQLLKWRASVGKVRSGLVMAGGRLWVANQGIKTGKATLAARDLDTGAAAWQQALGGECWSTPAISNGRVVVGCDDGKVYCFGH